MVNDIFLETASTPSILWILWVALGFFALIVIIGWLVSRNEKPEQEKPPEKHDH